MRPAIEVLAPSLPAAAVEAFETDVTLSASVYDELRADFDLPGSTIRVVLAEDFVFEVERYLRGPFRVEEGGAFTTERIGGVVAAKCLDQVGDASDFVIVFNASLWSLAEDPIERLQVAQIVAHEMAHPVVDRTRHVTGVMDGVIIPSVTGLETAASMARIMVGEYRADRLADAIVSTYITMAVDGETKPAFNWASSAEFYVASIRDVLGRAYPLWPDTVQEYRERRMPLEAMYGAIANSVDQTLTALVHAQASADSADAGRDLAAEDDVAELAAVRLYIHDTWAPFLEAMREGPQLGPIVEFRAIDEHATSVGRDAIVEIWRRLGLTILDHGNRSWGLSVAEPIR